MHVICCCHLVVKKNVCFCLYKHKKTEGRTDKWMVYSIRWSLVWFWFIWVGYFVCWSVVSGLKCNKYFYFLDVFYNGNTWFSKIFSFLNSFCVFGLKNICVIDAVIVTQCLFVFGFYFFTDYIFQIYLVIFPSGHFAICKSYFFF